MSRQSYSRVVELFLEFVQIDSPSREEALMAQEVARRLVDLGFEVTIDDTAGVTGSNTGNVIAHRAGTIEGKRVCFAAHLDQVSPCRGVKPQVGEDGIIRSDGTTTLGADDKSGIAAIFAGVEKALEDKIDLPDISLLFTVQEEVGLIGAKALDEKAAGFQEGDLMFVFDSDDHAGGICVGAPFQHSVVATFHGKAAHAGANPEDGRSAIRMAAQAISRMPHGRIDDKTTANAGLISGGTGGNVVPAECVIDCECRSLLKDRALEIREKISAECEQAAADHGGTVTMEWKDEYAGYLFDEDSEEVALIKRAAEHARLTPFCSVSGGGSDANVLSGKGFRAFVLGTGMSNFHTVDEYVSIEDLEGAAAWVRSLIEVVATEN